MTTIETYDHAGFTVAIHQDDSPESPRGWSNLGTFYMQRNGRQIQPDGDADSGVPWEDYDRDDYPGDPAYALQWSITRLRARGAVVIPLAYAYDGGVVECEDDDADGYAYITRARILAEMARVVRDNVWKDGKVVKPARLAQPKIVSPKLRRRAEECLRGEIETYNQWARGDVYGYVIEDEDGEHVDSLWGMYGYDYCREEAERAAEEEARDRAEQRAARLAEHARIADATAAAWAPAYA